MRPYRITVHCTNTPNDTVCPLDKIKRLHTSKDIVHWFGTKIKGFGFKDIGYHLVIQPSGDTETGRALNVRGAHVRGANSGNIGIALVGTDKFTKKQFVSLRYRYESLRLTYDIKPYNVWCHYEFKSAIKQGKTCPNIDTKRLQYWLNNFDENAISEYFLIDDISTYVRMV